MNVIAVSFFSFIERIFKRPVKKDSVAVDLFSKLFNAPYEAATLKKYGLTDTHIFKAKGIEHYDYSKFLGSIWLNDICVNDHIQVQIKNTPDFCAISSLANLKKAKTLYGPFCDKKITKLFQQKKMLFVPLHINSNHWALLAVDLKQKNIRYINSLSGKAPEEAVQNVRDHLIKIAKEEGVAHTNFPLITENCPKQENANDCGAFVLMAVRHLVRNMPLIYSQKEAPYMRLRALTDCLQDDASKNV